MTPDESANAPLSEPWQNIMDAAAQSLGQIWVDAVEQGVADSYSVDEGAPMTDAWSGWTAQDNADALLGKVADFYAKNDLYEPCCAHCGCKPGARLGHDDTCNQGCNDDIGLTVEARGVCDTLRAERDEALAQVASAREWAMALEARLEEVRVAIEHQHEPTLLACTACIVARVLQAPLEVGS